MAAWRHAPLIVRLDPDIGAALIATPVDRVPTDLLRRLPAPALCIPAPWLAEDCVVFAGIDSAPPVDGLVDGGEHDELIILACQPGLPVVFIPLRLSEPTITAALDAAGEDARHESLSGGLI